MDKIMREDEHTRSRIIYRSGIMLRKRLDVIKNSKVKNVRQ